MVSHIRHQVGAYSRYVKEFNAVPDPYKDENGLHNLLMSKMPEWQGAIVIPTDDFYVDILSKNKAELSKYYIVATANRRAIEIIQNKRLSYDLAMRLDIPAPITFFPENPENVSELAKNVVYPCILKAYEGHKFKRDYPRKVIEVDSPARLYSEYEGIFRQHPLMIQEVIEGDDSNIIGYAAYYDLAGDPLAEFTRRKIRQSPPSYGNAMVAESIHNPEIVSLSRNMLKELDYRGSLVSTEFKYDDRDGKLKFIEINARSVMWYSLVEASGMNLPWIMYQDLVLGKKVRQSSQEVNIFWIHETVGIPMLLRRGRQRLTIGEYLSPYFSKKAFAVFASDDLKPAIMDWTRFFLSSCTYPIRWCAGLIRKLRYRWLHKAKATLTISKDA
jgi:predicted ATP-grasp superfamily ATP-dependent carboligase